MIRYWTLLKQSATLAITLGKENLGVAGWKEVMVLHVDVMIPYVHIVLYLSEV